jgi:excisionase family DNA binding protein
VIAVSTSATPTEVLTVAEAAQLLRISTATVRRMVKRGELGAFRTGRQLRIHVDDLARLRTAERTR